MRLAKLLPALALIGIVLIPGPAHAQATRTWVSGVGDDANPCSRTAPCKTFAGAISKTAANGEINTLDPGGFGGVTINKSITINACLSGAGGVLVSGINAIVVNAAATDKVTLRCLDVNGSGTGLNGVRILQAKSVKILDSEIYGFVRNAVDVSTSNAGARVLVARSILRDNTGAGIMSSPTATGADVIVNARRNDITDNGCGIVSTQFGADPAFNFAVNCGTRASAGPSAVSIVNSFENLIVSSAATAVFSRGSLGINRLGLNEITGNVTGLQAVDGGQIFSFGNNLITGNGTNGAATGPVIPPSSP